MSKRNMGGRTARRSRRSGRPRGVLLAVFAILAGAGGTLYFGATHRGAEHASSAPPSAQGGAANGASGSAGPDVILPAPEVQQQAQSAGASSARQEVAIYQVATDDNGSHLSKSVLPTVGAPGASRDAIAAGALDAMARSKRSPLPPGTRTRSVHIDGDGLATVDFNRAFHDNFPGGDEAEALTVNAVLATLGQFTGVARVQFLVEGQKIDSLGGTQSLESPLPVPQANEASSASGASDTAVARGEP